MKIQFGSHLLMHKRNRQYTIKFFIGLSLFSFIVQSALAIPRQQDFGPTLRAGYDHAMIIGPGGDIVNWGRNDSAQILNAPSPIALEPESDTYTGYWLQMSISGRSKHTLAMNREGQWFAWGVNQFGQLGLGYTSNIGIQTPVGVPGQFKSIATGRHHTLALSKDGRLYSWGRNTNGQLGTGNHNNRSTPDTVGGLGSLPVWIAISAGDDFSLALNTNGKIYAWGSNINNRLGLNNSDTEKLTPFLIPGNNNANFVKIAAGKSSSIALKGNGTVWTWGNNAFGQLGRSTTAGAPGSVGSYIYRDIAIGGDFCLALRDNGTLWSWGANSSGQLGDNSTTKRTAPVQVKVGTSSLNNYFSMVAGENFAIAMHANGKLSAWGENTSGQLGIGTLISKKSGTYIPKNVSLPDNGARQGMLASGGLSTLMIKSDGSLWGMGDNEYRTLGVFITEYPQYVVPNQIKINASRDNNWIKIVEDQGAAFGIQADGTLWTWGVDSLEDGIPVRYDYGPRQLPKSGWVDIVTGFNGDHLALNSKGELYGWGYGFYHTNGSDSGKYLRNMPANPIYKSPSTYWVSVSLGADVAMGITSDGQLYAWGSTGERGGALGNGDMRGFENSDTLPVRIGPDAVDNNWLAVSAGYGCANAIRADGTLWGWGLSLHGESGLNGDILGESVGHPTQVTENGQARNDYFLINKSNYLSAVITTQDSVKMWGPRDPRFWGDPDGTIIDENGNDVSNTWYFEPRVEPSLAGTPVRQLSARCDFMTAVTTINDIFGMGLGRGYGNRPELSLAQYGGQLEFIEFSFSFALLNTNLIR